MPLIIFLISISLVCIEEKTEIKFVSYVLDTWMILKHIDGCKDRIRYISHV